MIEEIIESLQLIPHPEGGYFREYYRSLDVLPVSGLPSRFPSDRVAATSIYYLLPEGERSVFHRIKSDEVWVAVSGGGLELVELHESFGSRQTIVGSDIAEGELPSYVVPAGNWFAARPAVGAGYCLCVCLVAPGFEFADFSIASSDELLTCFPSEGKLIEQFT